VIIFKHAFRIGNCRLLVAPIALLFLITQAGCAAFNYDEIDAPIAQKKVMQFESKPKLALVLGSGGPRGYAHIGILKVLEEAGIKPDLIVGSSVGALIGAFWAAGYSADQIDSMSKAGGPLTVFDPNPFADRGWIVGQKLQNYVNNNLGNRSIQDLPTRLIIVATQRDNKEARFFEKGNIGVAVRASGAMPGIISPVGIQGIEYEDGDESLPVPVSVARDAGASFVIAVDVSARPNTTPAKASKTMRERDISRRMRIQPEVEKADFLIHPDLGYWASPRRAYFVESRRIGEETAKELVDDLVSAIQVKTLENITRE